MPTSSSSKVAVGLLVLLALAIAYVLHDARGSAPVAKSSIARHVATSRRALPATLEAELPSPWSWTSADETQRAAWRAFFAANERRLAPLDALHADARAVSELLDDGRATLAPPLSLREARLWTNLLVNRALAELESGRGTAAVDSFASAAEVGLLDSGDVDRWMVRGASLGLVTAGIGAAVREPAWDRERAWELLAPRMRAHVRSALAFGGVLPSLERGVARRVSGGELDLDPRGTSAALGELDDRVVARIGTRARLALIALGADWFRTSRGRWPASLADLHDLVGADEITCPFPASTFVFSAGANGAGLRVSVTGAGAAEFVPIELVR